MAIFKKLISVLVALTLVFTFTFFTASATEGFTMKSFDKGYVTFIFDDGKMPFTQEVWELFKEFDMPMSCAIVAKRIEKDSEIHQILLDVQKNGGEILSHGYSHTPIIDTTKPDYNYLTNIYGTGISTKEDIEYELGRSWKRLTNLGFNVNGFIEVGCGGAESTADYELVETVARKYYKYSNSAGVSSQYTQSRRFMNWDTFDKLKERIDIAAENHEWLILSAHNFNEISSDRPTPDDLRLRQLLNYIKNKNGEIEVVTWNYIYNTFGEYTGAKVPTDEALLFLTEEDKDSVFETSSTSSDTSSVESEDTSSVESEDTSTTSSSDASINNSTNTFVSSSVSKPMSNAPSTATSSTIKEPDVSQVTSITDSATEDTSSEQENTSSEQETISSEQVSSSSKQESVSSKQESSSSEQTVSETEDESTNKETEVTEPLPTKKQNHTGKFIAIGVACAVALASVIAAVVVSLKFK